MTPRIFLPLIALPSTSLAALTALPIIIADEGDRTAHAELGQPFDAVGRIFVSGTPLCSGTLVTAADGGAARLLTAAHCVDANRDGITDRAPADLTFRLGSDSNAPTSVHSIASIAITGFTNQPGRDFAVLVFEASSPPPAGISLTVSSENPLGREGTLIGFGLSGVGAGSGLSDDGIRLAARNQIDIANPDGQIRADFDSPAGDASSLGSSTPLPLEGSTGPGDSGGPLIVDGYIAGVLHGGFNPVGNDFEFGDVSIWSGAFRPENAAFLREQNIFVVPEPSVSLLMGLGGLLGALRRRR